MLPRPPLRSLALALLLPTVAAAQPVAWGPLHIAGHEVAPGTKQRLTFMVERSFIQDSMDTSLFVVRGERPGPTLCLTAAVHGDELNGVEIVRRVFQGLEPRGLSGTLLAMPIVNIWGFRSGNRYLPDRRDLNRAFPGNPQGSTASRLADRIFQGLIRNCDALVDLHTGSDQRTNLPQIRTDLRDPAAAAMALHFNVGVVIHGQGPEGSLRRAAMDAGVPAVIYEAGQPLRFEREEIARGVEGVRNVFEQLEMVEEDPPAADPQRTFRTTRWVRSPAGGIFLIDRELGDEIAVGDVLGSVTDPLTDERVPVTAPFAGTLVGMALPQVVLPGFGLFHLALHEGEGPPPIDPE